MGITGVSTAGGFDEQQNPLDIGDGASATGQDGSTALGSNSSASGNESIAIGGGDGLDTTASAEWTIAIGPVAFSQGSGSIAIGQSSQSDSVDSISIGRSSSVSFDNSVAIGSNSLVNTANSIAIGEGASAEAPTTGDPAISIGRNASAETGVVVGNSSFNQGVNGVAIGVSSQITDSGGGTEDSIAIGNNVSVSDGTQDSIVIGTDSSIDNGAFGSVVLGRFSSVAVDNVARIGTDQTVFGGTQDTLPDGNINNGELLVELDEGTGAFRLRGRDSTGTLREATVAW